MLRTAQNKRGVFWGYIAVVGKKKMLFLFGTFPSFFFKLNLNCALICRQRTWLLEKKFSSAAVSFTTAVKCTQSSLSLYVDLSLNFKSVAQAVLCLSWSASKYFCFAFGFSLCFFLFFFFFFFYLVVVSRPYSELIGPLPQLSLHPPK